MAQAPHASQLGFLEAAALLSLYLREVPGAGSYPKSHQTHSRGLGAAQHAEEDSRDDERQHSSVLMQGQQLLYFTISTSAEAACTQASVFLRFDS